MSRVGKKPIIIETGATVTTKNNDVVVAGAKGQLTVKLPEQFQIKVAEGTIEIKPKNAGQDANLTGLFTSLIKNAMIGVTRGWNKQLELVGVGFRAQTSGSELILNVGFSHPVKITAPPGISFAVAESKITVSGADKYLVGEISADIKRVKPPEPYKGKGIRYLGEVIRKKLGKAAKAVGGAGGSGGAK